MMTKRHIPLILLAIIFLTGCTQTLLVNADSAENTRQPPIRQESATPIRATATGFPLITQAALPVSTKQPTKSPTFVPPTLTAVPTDTLTPRPTATAVPTITPSSTPASRCRPATATIPHVAIGPGPWPRPPASQRVIHHGPFANNYIHLSFDVEGDGRILGSLLNVLDRHQVKTTFFIVGHWAEANSGWLAEAAARGHEFANHGYSHTHLRQLAPEQIQTELQQTEEIVLALTGKTTKPWLRPPYGGYGEETVQAAYEAGWTTVMWSGTGVDTSPEAAETTICNALMQYAEPGAILLLHTSNPAVVTAVDRFLTEINALGYTAVPLSVMMGG